MRQRSKRAPVAALQSWREDFVVAALLGVMSAYALWRAVAACLSAT